ncbi:MAG: metal ABC transporter substrate-binding protein [Eubacterium sp.]|nr:metal ABC transporter substrate-binding protein [Eubacterium sp.]
MKSKKLIAGIITAALAVGSITGCGSSDSGNAGSGSVQAGTQEKQADGEQLKIVTTIFPEYDWVKTIMGDKAENADITLLLDNGVDLHSYSPSVQDMAKIKECDMFIYVGGESDTWVNDVVDASENEDMVVINLLDVLGDSVKNEEIVEGMEHNHEHEHEDGEEDHDHDEAEEEHDHDEASETEAEEDHDHEEAEEADHDHDEASETEADHDHEEADDEHDHEDGEEEHEHEHEHETDEHVWLSLKNASVICDEIEKSLETLDPENKDVYKANLDAYKTELSNLDGEYKSAVDAAQTKVLLFGDRFPFRYMVDDYGIEYYAAFTGCSAESEASFETVIFLAEKTDEYDLPAVMTIEKSDQKIAETIINNTESKDQQILTLDSMQSTTSEDIANGTTYLSVMKSNLDVLKQALK